MVIMLLIHKIARDEIKKDDPKATVLANPVCGWKFPYFQRFLAAGGAKAVDVIADHPYHGPPAPEEPRWDRLTMAQQVRRMRAEIRKYRPEGMPIWWTEWAWLADDFAEHHLPEIGERNRYQRVPERAHAQYTVRSHMIGLSEGVEKFFHHGFLCHGVQEMCLLRIGDRHHGPKPVFCAYNTMTWMLNGRTFAGKVLVKPGVRAFAFQGADENVVAIWHGDIPEKSGTLEIPRPAGAFRVIDLMDNPVDTKTRAGRLVLPYDGSPRFLISKEPCPALLSYFERAQQPGPPR